MRKFVVAFAICGFVLSGCTRSGVAPGVLPAGAPAALPAASGAGYQLVYSFKSKPDGVRPAAGLTKLNGALWSTTSLGGTGTCPGGFGCGTVFSVTTDGNEKVVHRFKGGADGGAPAAGLTLLGGKFYGTASRGGDLTACPNTGCGVVFEISPSGSERVVYRFKDGNDGAGPYAGLVVVNGVLYGTTARGGSGCSGGCGTVFKVTPGGKEQVIYAFKNTPDGTVPLGGLTVVNGALYGTTQQGGASGRGAVFKVSTDGNESVIYSFKGSPDGSGPVQDLTKASSTPGVLYGITQNGGRNGTKNCGSSGCGTVFGVTTQGKETVLYRFKGSPDGTHPYASVTPFRGELYGTTGLGGIVSCYGGNGCGTIFKLTPSGKGWAETILYEFTVSGTYPQSGFTLVNGTMYGTSHGGGMNGFGSVYGFTP